MNATKPQAYKPPDLTPDELSDWAERAAIMEYLGNIPRDKAEKMAVDLVMVKRKRK